jgi:myo-inositol-1(or 4)-monophosphatase
MDLDQITRVAVRAAYCGAEVLRARFGNLSRISAKGLNDLVTDADLASEQAIIAAIRAQYPGHSILAEESGLNDGGREWRWLVDPLDGTVNFAHGLPFFAVSIAFAGGGDILAGVVLNPLSGELFSARRGKGAELNGKPIRVSATDRVSEALLATGFPYDIRPSFEAVAGRLGHCLKAARGVRRLGSAALDLCFVACGRFDGYWEGHLKPWDIAAGALIAREAGGRVSDLTGRPLAMEATEALASNGRIHQDMLKLMEVTNC